MCWSTGSECCCWGQLCHICPGPARSALSCAGQLVPSWQCVCVPQGLWDEGCRLLLPPHPLHVWPCCRPSLGTPGGSRQCSLLAGLGWAGCQCQALVMALPCGSSWQWAGKGGKCLSVHSEGLGLAGHGLASVHVEDALSSSLLVLCCT